MNPTRRHLLITGAAIAALCAGKPLPMWASKAPATEKRRVAWRNWSGGQHCFPEARLAPADGTELAEILRSAPRPVRPVGTGHSFTALVPTDGTVLSLDRLSGLIEADDASLEATFHAGTKLAFTGPALEEAGQALINMPDINRQTLAGSVATATHGTGEAFGSLSSYVTGLEIVTARGKEIWCDKNQNAEIFKAAQVSLGALGVITKIRMQNRTPYKIRRQSFAISFEEMMEQSENLARTNRNFEFFYIPYSSMCLATTLNETEEALRPRTSNDEDDSVMTLKTIGDYLGWAPKIREYLIRSELEAMPEDVFVNQSWKIFPSERGVRFNEMEYHLPRENALEALREIRDLVEGNNMDLFFPWEFRYVKSDDAWLSPFYEQETCSISVHRFYQEDYRELFSMIEPVLLKYGGRPHWGKLHTLKAAQFAQLYPRWKDFARVRKELDPEGALLNTHLREVLGDG